MHNLIDKDAVLAKLQNTKDTFTSEGTGGMFKSGFAMAQMMVDDTPIADPWIKTSEFLPSEGSRVLLLHNAKANEPDDRPRVYVVYKYSKYDLTSEITHWMPIPEPQKPQRKGIF